MSVIQQNQYIIHWPPPQMETMKGSFTPLWIRNAGQAKSGEVTRIVNNQRDSMGQNRTSPSQTLR